MPRLDCHGVPATSDLFFPFPEALLMVLPLSCSVASLHPEAGQAREGNNLQQRLRLKKEEVSAQSGQLSQPTASVIPLPQVPDLFCPCAGCYSTSSTPFTLSLWYCKPAACRQGDG